MLCWGEQLTAWVREGKDKAALGGKAVFVAGRGWGWWWGTDPSLALGRGRRDGGVTSPQSPKPLPEGHVQIPPPEGEKDTQHRQEFKQLILYLKNNKQPDF